MPEAKDDPGKAPEKISKRKTRSGLKGEGPILGLKDQDPKERMTSPRLVMLPIWKLKPYGSNPRAIPEEAVDAVAASIRDFGFRSPIIVDKDLVIISGHTRLKAADKLGLSEVPVIIAEDLDPEKAKALRLADNKTAELSSWDFDLLYQEIVDLSDSGLTMQDYGFPEIPADDGGVVDMSDLDSRMGEKTEDYQKFLDKFIKKPVYTTDDCFTPPEVYEAVKKWALAHYGIPEDREIVRPFYPGGDYEHFSYPDGCLVLDNPPFSFLTRILKFYCDRKIDFFLFCDARTSGPYLDKCNLVVPNVTIVYQNGVLVNTAFLTNLGPDRLLISSRLRKILCDVQEVSDETSLSEYDCPPNLLMSPLKIGRYAKYGAEISIKTLCPVKKLDCGKDIFGGGGIDIGQRCALNRPMGREDREDEEKREDRALGQGEEDHRAARR